MQQTIDCLLIGNNELDFIEYEKIVRRTGTDTGAYRYINTGFLHYRGAPANTARMLSLLSEGNIRLDRSECFSLAVAHLGSFLHRAGYTFDYANTFQEEKQELAEKLKKENIRTVALTTTYYDTPLPILEIVGFIRRHNRSAKIVIGGPYIYNQVTMQEPAKRQALFQSIGADYYIHSTQGEATLVRLLETLKNDTPPSEVNNLYYKRNDRYIATEVKEETNILTENPVNWELFAPRLRESAAVRSSISCPFSCAFCSYPQNAGKYQEAGVEYIEKQLDQLAAAGKNRLVHFIDDTFNVPPQRFKAILRMMIKKKYNFKWHSFYRGQFADQEQVELMKESGCIGVFMGFESGSDTVLKHMNKAATAEKYLRGVQLLKQYEILTNGSFIVGFPGETPGTVNETIDFIRESRLDFYRAYIWFADPRTPIYRKKEQYAIEGEHFEWSHNGMDWKTAYRLRDKMYRSVASSTGTICLPDMGFDFADVYHLMDKGMELEQIKRFLAAFGKGIIEKINDTDENKQTSVNPELLREMKESLLPVNRDGAEISIEESLNQAQQFDDGFDF